MPFDALVASPPKSTLSDTLGRHGISPVPWETLVLHKAAQQQRFGPSFWYRHQTTLSIMLVVASPVAGAVAGATGGFNAHSGVLAITGSFVWMCLVAPGYLVLAPWRRVTSHAALIVACVESVFLLMVSAAYSLVQIALPGPMGGLMALLLPLGTIAHGAWHVQRLTGSGWGYAVSRPVIAAVLFPFVIYGFVVVLMALTITLGP